MDYGADRARSAMLVVDGPGAAGRAQATLRDAGLDVGETLDFAGLAERVATGLSADLLFVEADADGGAVYDRLLAQVATLARGGQATIVSIVPELIDATVAALGDAPVALLCSTRAADRLAAVAEALAGPGSSVRQERAGDLRAIGADLGRIAERLVALADGGDAVAIPAVPVDRTDGVVVTAADFRRILRRRRLRDQYLGDGLFADPAWDMLLDLAAAGHDGSAVAVSSLCIAAAVPPTTALRWIRALTERGILERTPDPQDGRRVFLSLAPAAAMAMDAYAGAIRVLPDA